MKTNEILKYNDKEFITDFKRVTECMVYASVTRDFFKILKKDVIKLAETEKINYYVTDQIYIVRRDVMIIL